MTTSTTDRPRRRRLSRRARNAVLTVHIIVAVGLLGDSAGFLAVAVRGATTDDPALADASYELLRMFSYVFGIPLSFATLITGIVLGWGTTWGVFRSPWVTAKLVLILTVIAVGALAIDPALEDMLDGDGGSDAGLVVAAAYDTAALALATGLAVFKPGGRSWTRPSTAARSRSAHEAASDR